ncbi:hypothetical protein [Sphingomonas sp. BK036]|nr:hypothetical protein [Sphingomonas sp. BK036]
MRVDSRIPSLPVSRTARSVHRYSAWRSLSATLPSIAPTSAADEWS